MLNSNCSLVLKAHWKFGLKKPPFSSVNVSEYVYLFT